MAWGTPVNIGKDTTEFNIATLTVTQNVPAGSLIVVVAGITTTSVPLSPSVTDTQGNTYNLAQEVDVAGSNAAFIYYAYNVTALTSSVDTISFTGGLSGITDCTISAMYVTGTGAADPFDGSSHNSATGNSSTPSVTSFSPLGVGELFVGHVLINGFVDGFSDDFDWSYPEFPDFSLGSSIVSIPASTVNAGSGTQTYNPTLLNSVPWAAVIASFKLPIAGEPRRQNDWPNPTRRRVALNQGHADRFKLPLQQTLPERESNWPNPSRGPRRPVADWSQGATWLLSQPLPELPASRQLDWPNPRGAKPVVVDWLQTSTELATAPLPTLPASRQLDWPNPVRPRRPVVADWMLGATWRLAQPLPIISMARNRDWPVPWGPRPSSKNYTLINTTFLTPSLPQGMGEMIDNRSGRVRELKNEVSRVRWLVRN